MPNIARRLWQFADDQPERPALVVARDGAQTSYGDLRALAEAAAAALRAAGIAPDDRVIVMLSPDAAFLAVMFGAVAIGAVPVLMDPGLGLRAMAKYAGEVHARAIIAERAFHLLARRQPAEVRRWSRNWFPGAQPLSSLTGFSGATTPIDVDPAAAAIMAFTSGSTGEPKAVVMSHRVLEAQVDALAEEACVDRETVHLPFLSLGVVLGPALGCCTALSSADLSNIARARPRALAGEIEALSVTHTMGSPALFANLVGECTERDSRLRSLTHVLVGGAPASADLLRGVQRIIPTDAAFRTIYGATEAVPLTGASVSEVLADVPHRMGVLVGRPVRQVELKVDGADVGEVLVRGDIVASAYYVEGRERRLGHDDDWHRTGDMGELDSHGRLWLAGRRAHVVSTPDGLLYPHRVEPFLGVVDGIRRAALVGVGPVGEQRVVLVAEPEVRLWPWSRRRGALADALRAVAAEHGIPTCDILFRNSLPVDVRHRAKVLRLELSGWAASRLR